MDLTFFAVSFLAFGSSKKILSDKVVIWMVWVNPSLVQSKPIFLLDWVNI